MRIKPHVLVIYGGDSQEREVAIRSGKAVMEAAIKAGYKVTGFDYEGITSKDLITAVKDADVVLPILHGRGGEDGEIQSILEGLEATYLGSRVEASEHCFNKARTREMLQAKHILMPYGMVLDMQGYSISKLARSPHVIKPINGGSTIDTLIIRDVEKANASEINALFKTYRYLLVEELIEGTELTVSILEGYERRLPPIEIIPPSDGDFDYENKYNGKSQELCPPKNVSAGVQKEAIEIALEVHQVMGCRHLSRTDFMLDENNKLYVLEINTMPGLTDQSLFPKSAAAAGLDMPKLVDHFIKLATSAN